MSEVIIAGVRHGVYPLGGAVPVDSQVVVRRAQGLLTEFSRRRPGASIGIETPSEHSVFQVARRGLRIPYREDIPFTPRLRGVVARELMHRYAFSQQARGDFETALAKLRTFGDFRQAVTNGVFGFYEAIHLHAEELGLKVEPIDDPELRRTHLASAGSFLHAQQAAEKTFGPLSWLLRFVQLRSAGQANIDIDQRQQHMAGHVRERHLPLYFMGLVSAEAIHRRLRRQLQLKLLRVKPGLRRLRLPN